MYIADCLSRAHYATKQFPTDSTLETEADLMIHSVIENFNCSEAMIELRRSDRIKEQQAKKVSRNK